MLTRSH